MQQRNFGQGLWGGWAGALSQNHALLQDGFHTLTHVDAVGCCSGHVALRLSAEPCTGLPYWSTQVDTH